ncbi:O-acyltransferase like protein-like [Ischnura elegans]|uniref:O-acyltransferase like protein-like n=1 Tax=Ischnura elegans TaxID=197161 RepID=UPI001ED88A9D|nr:O-acyltransferase like protein-like [Ischnura elegans]
MKSLGVVLVVCWTLASPPATAIEDPWDEPTWVAQGGGWSGPPFNATPPAGRGICLRQATSFVSSADHLPGWALHMLSSSSELRDGLAGAFPPPLGPFSGCPSHSPPSSDFLGAVGKYCVANVTLVGPQIDNSTGRHLLARPLVENYLLSFCAEAACSSSALSDALGDFFNRSMASDLDAGTTVNLIQCKTWRREQPMHAPEIAAVCFIVFFGLMVIIGTCYEGFGRAKPRDNNGAWSRILLSFSLLTNAPKLIAASTNDGTMNCLFGLKFFSICWIIFGHTFYNTIMLPLTNPYYFAQLPKQWIRMLVYNESVAVDTFLLISGLLLAIVFLRERDRGVSFNPILFYLHRILRLTPPYAVVVFFYATLLYRLGSGPAWDTLVGYNAKTCRLNWWTNLLYVNNYVKIEEPCMDHSWYLAVDTQLYFVSPVVLLLMYRSRVFRLFVYPILVVVAALVPFSITAAFKLPAAMFVNGPPEDVTRVFTHVYMPAYARAGPYLVGVGLGFFLHYNHKRPLLLPKYVVALGWTFSTASLLTVIFGVYGLMQVDHVYNVWESSFYAGFHRTAWALALSWVIFACMHGYAGAVNSILSWSFLTPFARLTYCMYLSHYIIILYFAGSTRTSVYLSVNEVVRNFFGNLVIVVFVSMALSLTFEFPFVGISKAFIKREGRPRRTVDIGNQPDDSGTIAAPRDKGEVSPEYSCSGANADHPMFPDVEKGSKEETRSLGDRASNTKHAYSNSAYESTP